MGVASEERKETRSPPETEKSGGKLMLFPKAIFLVTNLQKNNNKIQLSIEFESEILKIFWKFSNNLYVSYKREKR